MTTARIYPMFFDQDPIEVTKTVADAAKASGTNWPAYITGFLIAVTTGFLALRKFLSSEAVTNAANAAQTDLINLLRQQIATERDRADKAEQARDAAMEMVGSLKSEIQKLTLKVESLEAQIQATAKV